MAVQIRAIPTVDSEVGNFIVKILKEVLTDLEDQLNKRGQIYVNTEGKIPAGLQQDDVLLVTSNGDISLLVRNAKGFDRLTAEMLGGLTANGCNFLGFKSGTALPSTGDFPKQGDFGFYYKTTATTGLWLVFNRNGVVYKAALT